MEIRQGGMQYLRSARERAVHLIRCLHIKYSRRTVALSSEEKSHKKPVTHLNNPGWREARLYHHCQYRQLRRI